MKEELIMVTKLSAFSENWHVLSEVLEPINGKQS